MLFRWKSRSWVTRLFKKNAKKIGLNDARFHDLRHTFGSHLVMSGEHIKVIQELMRHQDLKSTLVYAKVSPNYLKKASNNLNYGPMPVGKKG
jgi:site-specific recombinase XerD